MRRRARSLLLSSLLALPLAASACHPRSSEIVVVVSTDLAPGTALRAVKISGANAPDATVPNAPQFESACTAVGDPPAVAPPFTLSVLTDKRGARITLTAKGYDDPSCATPPIVRQSATAAFVEGAAVRLDLALEAQCVMMDCPTGQTCHGGGCTSDTVDALPAFTGTP